MLAGIEAGGTKMVCAVGPDPATILRRAVIPTGVPAQTLDAIIAFLRDRGVGEAPIHAIGVASFGPLDLDPASPGYGAITRTPKPGWSGVNLRARLATALQCGVAIDTDVNGSGLAEAAIGAGRGCRTVAYVTVGTGIGGGLIVDGRPLHGLTHPEMGHIRLRRHEHDDFAGICPFHGDCLEGLASGAALQARIGRPLSDLPPDDPLFGIIADYLGQLCATLILMVSPQRIILGGGVMSSTPRLFELIRPVARALLAGYIAVPGACTQIDATIVPPGLGDHAGITGALMLARDLMLARELMPARNLDAQAAG